MNDDVIFSYTVEQGVTDGVFVLAPESDTHEAGYRIPVAFTTAAWAEAVAWDRREGPPQDEAGRLWDVLMVMRGVAKPAILASGARQQFTVLRVPNRTRAGNPSKAIQASRADLEVVMQGWNDDGAPCLTVLLPGED